MRARLALPAVLAAAGLGVAACGSSSSTATTSDERSAGYQQQQSKAAITSEERPARTTPTKATGPAVKTIATGLAVPWGIAFLPDGDALVAQRGGTIVRVPEEGGRARTVKRMPGVAAEGEGGLLGLAVSPNYRKDKLVYAYFTTNEDNRIARFKLGGGVKPILTGINASPIHNGGRIAFGPDGKLYAGVGDASESDIAQDPRSLNGKILRMDPDGGVPEGNPFPGSRTWSYGHRNVQGLAWDGDGRLWASEFGQNTTDELNLIRKGANYGWPEVEGEGSTDGGKYTNPKRTWATSDASPSGLAYLRGNLYMGALGGQRVWKIPVEGERAGTPSKLLDGKFGRIRTVVRTPRDELWFSTSNRDGRGEPKSGDDRIRSFAP